MGVQLVNGWHKTPSKPVEPVKRIDFSPGSSKKDVASEMLVMLEFTLRPRGQQSNPKPSDNSLAPWVSFNRDPDAYSDRKLQLVFLEVSDFILVLKNQHVSNGCKQCIF